MFSYPISRFGNKNRIMPLKERSMGSAPSATDEEPRHNAPGAIIAELDILKPLQTVVNDDSPQFTLLDVEVLAIDSNKIVNLLHAELGGPFRVRGTLLLDRKQKAKYCKRKRADTSFRHV